MFHAVDVERVKRMFLDPDRHAGTFAWYIKARKVLQWGGLSDAFDPCERRHRVSLRLLQFFRELQYPISISTKATWWTEDPEYTALLRGAEHVHVKTSIITTDRDAAAKIERGVATPAERFASLRRLKDLGVGCTTLRFRPFIPGVSDRTMEAMVEEGARAGVFSLTTEFLCIDRRIPPPVQEQFRALGAVAGMDLLEFYRANSPGAAGLMRLNYEYKRPLIDRLKALCTAKGIAFHCSDAHHAEKGATAMCCGLPEAGALGNWSRGHFKHALILARERGRVTWADIAPHAEGLKEIPFASAEGFNSGGQANRAKRRFQSMWDYMRETWNTPSALVSPARYFGGVLVPAHRDGDGDVVYLYNRPLVERGEHVQSVEALEQELNGLRLPACGGATSGC